MAENERRVKAGMNFGGKDYALVPDRIKMFREEKPRGSIDTNPTYNEDGSVTFKAIVISDLADPASARASGTARYDAKEIAKPKAFEKLETISIGRALSVLGYLNNGEVASSEEMEDWLKDRGAAEREKEAQEIEEAVKSINAAKTNDELNTTVQSLGKLLKHQEIIDAGKAKRAEFKPAADVAPAIDIPPADDEEPTNES